MLTFLAIYAFVFSYADYSLCLFLLVYFFSIEGKSNLNALIVGCFLSTSIILFLPLGREGRPFGFSWKGKHDTWDVIFYFLLLSCTEMGSEIWCSIFWTNILNEVFLVWWYCTISNVSGTIWTQPLSPNLLIWPTRKETNVKCLPFLSQFKQDVTYRPAAFI